MEEILADIMFTAPSDESLKEIVISEKYIKEQVGAVIK